MRIKSVVGVIVALIFFLPLFSFSETVVLKTVKKSGGDFSSLKAALEAIPQDLVWKNETWIIEIQDEGPYVQDVARIYNKRTDAGHQIVVRSASGVTPKIQSQRGFAFQISRASYVTLDGLKFVGERGNGVVVDNSSYVTIKNSTIAGATYQGITFYRVQSSSLLNNRVYSCTVGVYLVDSPKNQIDNNLIYHTFYAGVSLGFNSPSTLLQNNVFFNNPTVLSIEDRTGGGIQFIHNVMDGGKRGEYFYRIATNVPPQTVFDFNRINLSHAKLARLRNEDISSLSQWRLQGQDLESIEEEDVIESLGLNFNVQKIKKSIAKRHGDFSSIQEALVAMPRNLVEANESWELEFKDSEIYREPLHLNPMTSPEHFLVIRANPGQTPQLEVSRKDAVMLTNTQYVTIEGLTINPGAYRGINLSQSRFCTIHRCMVKGVWGAGISIFGGFQHTITENTIYASAVAMELYSYAQANVIKDNIFYRNKAYGITLQSSPLNHVEGNILFNNGYFELWVSDGGGIKFLRNILYNEGKWGGMSLENGVPVKAQFDENIYYFPVGPVGRVSHREYYSSSSKGSMFRIFSRKGQRTFRMVYTYYQTLGGWQGGTGLDTHSQFKDPQFRSTILGQEDFRIRLSEENKPQEETPTIENKPEEKEEEKEKEQEKKQEKKDTSEENNVSNKGPGDSKPKEDKSETQNKPKKEDALNKFLRK